MADDKDEIATESTKTSAETTKNTLLPSLLSCITTIKKLALTTNTHDSVDPDVYTSMLAFLCHLKNDQAAIFHAYNR